MAKSSNVSYPPIKRILKKGSNECQTFPGKFPAKHYENSDTTLNLHSKCKVSNSDCSVSCCVSHIQGSDCCVNSRSGSTCRVRERENLVSSLGRRGSARRPCSEPCSDNGQARSITPLPRPASEIPTGVSQVSFHSIVEKFRPNGDTEYLKLSISSTPGRIYHPERQSSKCRTRRPMVKTSTRKYSIDCAARCWSISKSGASHLAQADTHQQDRDPAQTLPVAVPPGPEPGTPISSSAPDPRTSPGHQGRAAPASKTDAVYLR